MTDLRLLLPLGLAFTFALALLSPGVRAGENGPGDGDKKQKVDAMFAEARQAFPDVPVVTVAGLEALQARGPVVIVDVRTAKEQEVSMIPGAVRRDELDVEQTKQAGAKVVAYCTIGYRAGIFAKELREKGIDAYDLAGSILAWAHAGKPLEAKGAATNRVHVFGAKWDLLPAGYEAVR